MKKILIGIAVLLVGITAYGSVASAHYLLVTGTSSCVREDGSWDWTATYTIPDEDWAEGLTVVVTWDPSSSGTTTADYVYVTAHGVFSNQQTGDGSTKIWKGEECPVDTTTTTSEVEQSTTTTSTVTSVVPTTTVVATTISSPPLTESPSTIVTPTTIVQATPTTTVVNAPLDLPATGAMIWAIVLLGGLFVVFGLIALYIKRIAK